MLTTVASVPAYSLPGVPPLAQPRAAGDPPDSGLATEILPAPPSLASLHQALAAKQDPKKPSQPISYLPQHDPGTTFSSYWATPNSNSAQSGETEGRRPKRVRASKEAGGLAARGSFRGAFHAPSVVEPVVVEDTAMLDTFDTALDSEAAPAIDTDNMTASRSNSVPPSQPQDSRRRARPLKDKGKGRDGGDIRVKEEPIPVTLPPADGPSSSLRNQDHCSACRSLGSLVYCDSCTRAYHLLCLDPPMEASDLPEGENRWYCPACHLSKNPRPKPPPSFLSSLIQQVQTAPPTEFQLPEDIRTYFKHVGTNTRGAYVDTSVLRPPRLNRLGQLEDRDPHRTKDRNGVPVLCFRCGTSAYTTPVVTSISSPSLNKRPRRSTTQSRQSSEAEWRSIVSCDYCSSHWHLDCLDPPLTSMPPFDKKWMCPNHAEHVLRVKPRIPKQNPTVIDVSHPGVLNNGNIEVLESGDSSYENKVLVDEVFINGRKYRVPERVIKLDFWNKLSNTEPNPPPPSSPAISVTSSLTSLSSLDEIGPPPSTSATSSTPGVSSKPDLSTWDVNDLRGALLLLDFTQENTAAPVPARFTPRPTARPAPARSAPRPLPARNAPRVKREPLQSDTILLTAPPPAMYSRTPGPTTEPYYPPFSTSVFSAPILPSTTAPVPAATSAPDAGRRQPARASKREIIYTLPGLDDDTDSGSSRPPPKARKPARQRAPRKSAPPRASVAPPVNSTADAALRSTPSAHPPINAAGALQSSANVTPTNGTTKSPQTTPSLKIRLPRLSDLKPQSQAHVQAQTQAQAQAPVSPTPTAKVRRSARRSEPAGESKAEE